MAEDEFLFEKASRLSARTRPCLCLAYTDLRSWCGNWVPVVLFEVCSVDKCRCGSSGTRGKGGQ